ncbi:MAG: alpha/beta hydrolase fold domain-containing protein [Gammaproteobacteria bacterium]|nr:alpha/beta hydrolase fold domain-containing protein [Gammaproteobacteria bacterium]
MPAAVLLHGGCWQARFDLTPMGQLARSLTRHGCAIWNLEYRRIGNGGGWPNTFLDVATGTDHLRRLAPEYNLDTSGVVSIGHSAGGHLALWLAGRHRLPRTSPLYVDDPMAVHGVVAIAGIADLALANRLGICRGAAQTLLEGSIDEHPERYAQASPDRLLPLAVPHRHLTGRDDRLVSGESVRAFVDRARQRGDDVTISEIDECGHFELVTAGTPAAAIVEETVAQLIAANKRAGEGS